MRTPASLTKVSRLRWAPAIALTVASLAFAVLAMELAPRAPTRNVTAQHRPARSTTRRGPRLDQSAPVPAPTAREPSERLPRRAAEEPPGAFPDIASFFPPAPMTLPQPLDEGEPAPAQP